MAELKVHPVAALFPLIEGAEFEQLKASIAADGQRVPIEVWQGQLLDGRNRLRACEALGIEPRIQEYTGDTPVAFIWSLNLTRRHLTASQRACIAVEMLPEIEAEARKRQATSTGGANPQLVSKVTQAAEEPAEKSRDVAAKAVGVSNSYVQAAKNINRANPDLFAAVRSGEMTVNEAYGQVKTSKLERQAKQLKDAGQSAVLASVQKGRHELATAIRGVFGAKKQERDAPAELPLQMELAVLVIELSDENAQTVMALVKELLEEQS